MGFLLEATKPREDSWEIQKTYEYINTCYADYLQSGLYAIRMASIITRPFCWIISNSAASPFTWAENGMASARLVSLGMRSGHSIALPCIQYAYEKYLGKKIKPERQEEETKGEDASEDNKPLSKTQKDTLATAIHISGLISDSFLTICAFITINVDSKSCKIFTAFALLSWNTTNLMSVVKAVKKWKEEKGKEIENDEAIQEARREMMGAIGNMCLSLFESFFIYHNIWNKEPANSTNIAAFAPMNSTCFVATLYSIGDPNKPYNQTDTVVSKTGKQALELAENITRSPIKSLIKTPIKQIKQMISKDEKEKED